MERLGSICEGLLEFRLRAGGDGLMLENDEGERTARFPELMEDVWIVHDDRRTGALDAVVVRV
ncbi:MAG: hypothetical protein ACODAB_07905 [Gemmatimonadota bacterium]